MTNELQQLLREAWANRLTVEATQYMLARDSNYSLSQPQIQAEFDGFASEFEKAWAAV